MGIHARPDLLKGLSKGLKARMQVKWLGERSVTEPPYREKLLVIGGKGLHHEIRREMAVIGQGGTRVCACAIAKHLNKQRMAAHLKIELN